jgi:hypothetical protein
VGEEVSFNVTMRSPNREGRALFYWRLKTANRILFGPEALCDVRVVVSGGVKDAAPNENALETTDGANDRRTASTPSIGSQGPTSQYSTSAMPTTSRASDSAIEHRPSFSSAPAQHEPVHVPSYNRVFVRISSSPARPKAHEREQGSFPPLSTSDATRQASCHAEKSPSDEQDYHQYSKYSDRPYEEVNKEAASTPGPATSSYTPAHGTTVPLSDSGGVWRLPKAT